MVNKLGNKYYKENTQIQHCVAGDLLFMLLVQLLFVLYIFRFCCSFPKLAFILHKPSKASNNAAKEETGNDDTRISP